MKNTDLVALCAREPWNRKAWLEFYERFDDRIRLVIYRECKAICVPNRDAQFQETAEDLLQDVYMKLLSNNCKALNDFIGASENSIYTYLGIIARNVVRNYTTKINAQKRPTVERSIDDVLNISEKGGKIRIKNIARSPYAELELEFLKEEIEIILDRIVTGSTRHRNKLIIKLNIYQGLSAEQIASQLAYDLSAKTVSNLITKIKQKLRQQLLDQMMAA